MKKISFIIFFSIISLLYIGCSDDSEEIIDSDDKEINDGDDDDINDGDDEANPDSYIQYSIDGKTYKNKATATLYYDGWDNEYELEIKSNDIEIWYIIPKDLNELTFVGEYNLGNSDYSYNDVPDLFYNTYFRSERPLFYGTQYTTDNNLLLITEFIVNDSIYVDPLYIPKSGTLSGNFVAKVYFMDIFNYEPDEFILDIEGTINNIRWYVSW